VIHYITVGVALERPPKEDERRRYSVAAASHSEAALVATQMAACTSVMPVSVIRSRPDRQKVYDCLYEGCTVAIEGEPDIDADRLLRQGVTEPTLTGPCGCPCDACSFYCEQIDAATPPGEDRQPTASPTLTGPPPEAVYTCLRCDWAMAWGSDLSDTELGYKMDAHERACRQLNMERRGRRILAALQRWADRLPRIR
jgi:hypothetical protein